MRNGHVLDQASLDAILVESSALMKRGLRLAGQSSTGDSRSALQAAIECFDGAARLRANLPLESHAAFRYDLAACYLNRAEALLLLDEPVSVTRAIAALDEGVGLLETLPLGDDPRFVRRLAVAYQNRGLPRLRHEPVLAGGEDDLRTAIALLGRTDVPMPDDRDHLLAAACVNLAAVLAERADPSAETFARRAVNLQSDSERTAQSAAAVTLRARHVLCRGMAAGDVARVQARCADATDLAEDALSVIASWERQSIETFRSLACDFFAFGAGAYASYQPQFLEEFLAEWLDASHSSVGFVTTPAIVQAADRARNIATMRRLPPIRFTASPRLELSARSL